MNYETQNAAEEMFVLADQLRALREEKVQAEPKRAHLPQPGEKRNCSLPCGRPDTAT